MVQQAVDAGGDELSEVSILLAEVRHQFGAASPEIRPLAETREAIRQAKSDYQRVKDALDSEIERLRLDDRRSKAIAPAGETVRDQLQQELDAKEEERDELMRAYETLRLQLRGEFNRRLGRLNRSALCLSGGGIRSGSFALGVLQALATYPRRNTRQPSPPQQALLGQMDFLSTVSGGGYIGSWLSAWLCRAGYEDVQPKLVARPLPSKEPPEIENLRRYSNFLTPKLGVLSADSWAAIALYFRNLFLNWLILLPAICLPLLLLKLFAVVAAYFARDFETVPPVGGVQLGLPILAVILAIAAMIYALRNVTVNRPTYAENGIDQTAFLGLVLLPVIFAAICWSGFFLSPAFAALLRLAGLGPEKFTADSQLLSSLKIACLVTGAVIGCVIYSLGWLCAAPWRRLRHFMQRPKSRQAAPDDLMPPARQLVVDWLQFAGGGLVYGLLLGLGAYLLLLAPHILSAPAPPPCQAQYHLVPDVLDLTLHQAQPCSAQTAVSTVPADLAWKVRLFAAVALGLPWLVLAQLTGEAVFTGLGSFAKSSDSDREWLGRAAGWYLLVALGWIITVLLVYGGSTLLLPTGEDGGTSWTAYFGWVDKIKGVVKTIGDYLAPIGGLSAVATALLSGSSLTGGRDKPGDDRSPVMRVIAENGLTIAALIFLISLIVFLSTGLDQVLLGKSLLASDLLLARIGDEWGKELWWLAIGLIGAALLAAGASACVNINRFSLHALYRNRLIREFLGATNLDRRPNLFTGFALKDNMAMHELRGANVTVGGRSRLLHIVNITLNLVGTSNLAWQERKGESFTVSPLHSGAALLGYRDSQYYAKGEEDGISLGTAVAISGAAASPNMGYHSSPLITIIMTLLNVRLGWWLGNPARPRADLDGPRSAIKWIAFEAFGLTTEDKDFVYLSDGGHFENLALYEMVRRRCRYIIVSDGGCDPTCALSDLGTAVRMIEIDLGVRITFPDLCKLKPRLSVEDARAGTFQDDQKCWCIGRIGYKEADYKDGNGEEADGYIVYIKPSFRGKNESAGVRAYALAHPDFPHEPTSDQWFSESQFESYRKLGFDIAEELLASRAHQAAVIAVGKRGPTAIPELPDFFEALAL
ncbi:MAG TPA: patatin-like phospholipase family protein [Dongiaceae bacterium]|nr:patatin-like phospholipase family protein [Dongiaceae bacterium]